MTSLARALRQVDRVCEGLGLHWAMIGAMAMNARLPEPRTTRDLDVAVAVPGDAEAEAIIRDFLGHGFRQPDEWSMIEHKDRQRLATMRLEAVHPGGEATLVDFMFASSGIEDVVVAMAERMDILPGLPGPVARTGHLIALKVLASRPQDLVDVRNLLQIAGPEERHLAREAADLIERRGYDRDVAVVKTLEELLAEVDGRA